MLVASLLVALGSRCSKTNDSYSVQRLYPLIYLSGLTNDETSQMIKTINQPPTPHPPTIVRPAIAKYVEPAKEKSVERLFTEIIDDHETVMLGPLSLEDEDDVYEENEELPLNRLITKLRSFF